MLLLIVFIPQLQLNPLHFWSTLDSRVLFGVLARACFCQFLCISQSLFPSVLVYYPELVSVSFGVLPRACFRQFWCISQSLFPSVLVYYPELVSVSFGVLARACFRQFWCISQSLFPSVLFLMLWVYSIIVVFVSFVFWVLHNSFRLYCFGFLCLEYHQMVVSAILDSGALCTI